MNTIQAKIPAYGMPKLEGAVNKPEIVRVMPPMEGDMPNHGAQQKSNPVRPLAALRSILRRCPVWMWSRASPVQDSPAVVLLRCLRFRGWILWTC